MPSEHSAQSRPSVGRSRHQAQIPSGGGVVTWVNAGRESSPRCPTMPPSSVVPMASLSTSSQSAHQVDAGAAGFSPQSEQITSAPGNTDLINTMARSRSGGRIVPTALRLVLSVPLPLGLVDQRVGDLVELV